MDIAQIILIVVMGVLIISYPILVNSRDKKERQRLEEQTNSRKRGDKVMTTSGFVGTVVDLHQEGERTIVTLETGMGKNKGYMSIDALAIHCVLDDNFRPVSQEAIKERKEKVQAQKTETTKAEPAKTVEATVAEKETEKKADLKKAKTEKKAKQEDKKESE